MHPDDFLADAPGDLVAITSRTGQQGWSLVPHPLPPNLVFDTELAALAETAALSLGRLSQLGRMLPNPTLLIRPFIRREALASSRMEGTRAEYDQLVLLEASSVDEAANPDAEEVRNYVRALESGWNRPAERPISTGFIMELHQQLMDGVCGQDKNPGRLRSMELLTGSPQHDLVRARFVPPLAAEVRGLLDDLAFYINQAPPMPALVRLALIHYQFETIHPFEDGIGRLGRLLMSLILGSWGLLDQPILYLSEHFELHRDEYIDHLLAVSQKGPGTNGSYSPLRAIETQAKDAVRRGQLLLETREALRSQYQASGSGKLLTIVDALFENPAITIHDAMRIAGLGYSQAGTIVRTLEADGILVEVTGRKRNMVFLAPTIVGTILGEDYHFNPNTPVAG
jgi:Fic family protein